jgi:hypothetical protein
VVSASALIATEPAARMLETFTDLDSHDLGPAAIVAGTVLLAGAAGVTIAYKRPLGSDTVKGILGRMGVSLVGLAVAVALALVLFVLGLGWAAGTVLVWAMALLMTIGLRGREMQHPLPLLLVAWFVPALTGWIPLIARDAASSSATSLNWSAMIPAVIATIAFLVWRLSKTYATEGEVDIW